MCRSTSFGLSSPFTLMRRSVYGDSGPSVDGRRPAEVTGSAHSGDDAVVVAARRIAEEMNWNSENSA